MNIIKESKIYYGCPIISSFCHTIIILLIIIVILPIVTLYINYVCGPNESSSSEILGLIGGLIAIIPLYIYNMPSQIVCKMNKSYAFEYIENAINRNFIEDKWSGFRFGQNKKLENNNTLVFIPRYNPKMPEFLKFSEYGEGILFNLIKHQTCVFVKTDSEFVKISGPYRTIKKLKELL